LNHGDFQKWNLLQGQDWATLVDVATHKVLDSSQAGEAYTRDINGGDYQRWKLRALGNDTFILTNLATGRVLDSGH